MKRFLLMVCVLGLFAAGVAGCHASGSGDVGPNHASNAVLPQ